MPGSGTWSGSAGGDSEFLQCPRCKHSVRYRACPQCRLGLYCRVCGVRLTDPLSQTFCDVCGEAIEQAAYPAVTSEAPAAATESPESATVPPLVPRSPTTAKVEELVGSFRGAGSVRREAADYAAALMANGQLTDALAALTGALAEVGEEPPDAQLLLLRGHCLQSIGQPGPALQDLLASAQADPGLLPSVAPGLQRLLLTADASEFRRQILDSWAPALERQVSSDDHLLLCEIELQAAVLQHDSERALDVVARVQRAHAEVGVASCADMLAGIRLRAPAEGSLFGALARTEAALGLAEEAIADADRAVQLGLSERGAQAALLEFKAGLLSKQGLQAQATSMLRQAGKCAYYENDFKNAVRLLRRTWAVEADAETGWHLADALRRLAADPADDQLAVLREALEVGERVASFESIGSRFPWGYSVLAQIHVDLVPYERLAGADHELLAALSAERLLLLEPDMFTFALLAKAYRGLNWHALCAEAASRCRAALHDRPDVLGSLGYAQLQAGVPEFTDTLASFLRHPQISDLSRGQVDLILGRNDEALAVLGTQCDSPEDGLKARALTARLMLKLGREAEAETEFRVIRERGKMVPEWLLGIGDRAFAAYVLGEYAESLDLLQPAIEAGSHSSYEPFDVYGTAMLCHLARGDLKQAVAARATLLSGVCCAYEGEQFLIEMARLGRRQRQLPEVVAEIETSTELIRVAVADVRRDGLDLDVALVRLDCPALESSTGESAATRLAVGAMASCRLLLERDRWEEAARTCTAILDSGSEDPICADAVVGRLFVAVDNMLRGGNSAAALDVLRRVASSVGPDRRREVAIRIIFVGLADDMAEPIQPWVSEIHDSDWQAVAYVLRATAPDVETLYRIAARAQQVQLPGLGQALLRIAEDALGLNLGEDAGGATAPIVVEVGADLIVVDPPADGPLFRIQLPALRDRVEKRTGVRLPAVLIRAVRELPRTAFQVSAAGQWPESGQVEPGMVYVRRPSEEVTAALGGACRVVATTDPVSREASCWATYVRPPIRTLLSDPRKASLSAVRGVWENLLQDTGTWDDPLAYPLAVLEHHVITRLSHLVTADDMAAIAERWCQGTGIDLDARVVDSGLGRLTTVCRDLLDEGIALIPRPGSGAELERILDEAMAYPAALAVARDIFRTQLPEGGAR